MRGLSEGNVRMAERSKAPDSRVASSSNGAFWSTYVGVGSNPTSDRLFYRSRRRRRRQDTKHDRVHHHLLTTYFSTTFKDRPTTCNYVLRGVILKRPSARERGRVFLQNKERLFPVLALSSFVDTLAMPPYLWSIKIKCPPSRI